MKENLEKLEQMIEDNYSYDDILKQSHKLDTYIEDKIRETL